MKSKRSSRKSKAKQEPKIRTRIHVSEDDVAVGPLTDLGRKCNETAKAKGWWEGVVRNEHRVPAKIALIHSEVSEALEAFRDDPTRFTKRAWLLTPREGLLDENSRPAKPRVIYEGEWPGDLLLMEPDWHRKPIGFGLELADTLIRVLDLCYAFGIDIDSIVAEKMEYNEKRPYKHGGKAC